MSKEVTIVKHGGAYKLFNNEIEVMYSLTPGNVYVLKMASFGQLELVDATNLELPKKIYDFEVDFRSQVLKTLNNKDSKNNVGVLLEGYKGQGKSVVAKQLAIESKLPIIMIDSPINKEYDLIGFLNSIKLDHVLFIDEFEKIFAGKDDNESKVHSQNVFLTLLDGIYSSTHKRLFLITTNDEIGDKFINRPSRIRYYKKYNFMKKQVYEAIIDDLLIDKSFKADLEDNINPSDCTIDLLTTIIEEINLHNKPYSEFKEFFNHKEKKLEYSKFKMEKDGTWKWVEDVTVRREIGPDDNLDSLIHYPKNLKVISNDGEIIIYSCEEWITSEEFGIDEDGDPKGKYIRGTFKLKKPLVATRISGGQGYSEVIM
jgi:hypothetical protein